MKALCPRIVPVALLTLVVLSALPPLGVSAQEPYGNPQLLVTAGWLAENTNLPNLRIIDFGRTREEYDAGHIPGAVYVSSTWLATETPDGAATPVFAANAANVLSAAGVGDSTTVVVYDGSRGLVAARLFWIMEYLGHRDVRLLNGGLAAWVGDGHEVSKAGSPVARENFVPEVDPARLASKSWVLENLDNPLVKILDVRNANEYAGLEVKADRGGHIPGAVNVDWTRSLSEGDTRVLLPTDLLKGIYEAAGLSLDSEIVTYCQAGGRADHTYFVLRLLGYPSVRVYDASWAEWGNDPNAPIVKGPAPR
jgi:thiosulfate/3-mercaptopyruvate sulfurtransferase